MTPLAQAIASSSGAIYLPAGIYQVSPNNFGVASGRNPKTSNVGYPSPGPIADWQIGP